MRVVAIAVLAALVGTPSGGARPRGPGHGPPPSLVTERDRYTATVSPLSVDLQIGLRYTNRTKTPRFFPGCREPDPPVLEKLVDGAWVAVYGAVVLGCKTPPLVVAPGESYAFVFYVAGGRDDSTMPRFEAKDVPGTYRARWRAFRRWNADEDREEDPELVLSNDFEVVVAPR